MGRFDLFGWLVSMIDRKRARPAAYLFLVGGPAFLAYFAYKMTQVPWQLNRDSPVAISIGGGCSPEGATYSIVVRDTVFVCGGGDTKCAFGAHEPVAYELDWPRHCRLRKYVDRPSLLELTQLWIGLLLFTFGGAYVCWDAAWIRRLEAPDGNPPPTIAYRIFRLAFWFVFLAFVATAVQESRLYGWG